MSTPRFAAWFDRQLRRREWSTSEFARRSGVATSTASAWRRGTRVPDPPACENIAETLRIGLDTVLNAAGHRPLDVPEPSLPSQFAGIWESLDEFDRASVMNIMEGLAERRRLLDQQRPNQETRVGERKPRAAEG